MAFLGVDPLLEDPIASLTQQSSGAISVTAAMNLPKGALESVTVTLVGEVSEVSGQARVQGCRIARSRTGRPACRA